MEDQSHNHHNMPMTMSRYGAAAGIYIYIYIYIHIFDVSLESMTCRLSVDGHSSIHMLCSIEIYMYPFALLGSDG